MNNDHSPLHPMTLYPLGTNGYFPALGRHTASYLLEENDTWILIDAGTGVGRLADPAIRARLPEGDVDLHVLLSHYHLDHICGLVYLPALWPRGRLHLHLPGPPFVEADPVNDLDRLLHPPFAQPLEKGFKGRAVIVPFSDAAVTIGAVPCRFWPQRHPGGSTGMRIGESLVVASDKAMDDVPEAACDADLLLHEVWLTDAEAARDERTLQKHCAAADAARFAREARCNTLIPIHHYPTRTADDLEAIRRSLESQSGIPTRIAEEGRPL